MLRLKPPPPGTSIKNLIADVDVCAKAGFTAKDLCAQEIRSTMLRAIFFVPAVVDAVVRRSVWPEFRSWRKKNAPGRCSPVGALT